MKKVQNNPEKPNQKHLIVEQNSPKFWKKYSDLFNDNEFAINRDEWTENNFSTPTCIDFLEEN